MRKLVCIISFLLSGLFSPQAVAVELELDYQMFTGGFDVGRNNIELAIDGRAFRMRSDMTTGGLINFITGFSAITTSEGEIGEHPRIWTRRNRVESRFLGNKRWSSMEFTDGRPVRTQAEPPPEEDDREKVPAEMTIGTVDLLTAGLTVARFAAGDVEQPLRIAVFDGRRRFDLEIKAAPAEERMKPISSQYFSGPALRLDIALHRIAGYMKNPRFQDSGKPTTGQVWFTPPAENAPGLAVPVRLEMDTAFGLMVIHLTGKKNSFVQ